MTSLFPLAAPYAVTSPSGRGAFSFRRARTLSPIAPGPLSGAATSAVARLTRSLPARMAMDGSPVAVRAFIELTTPEVARRHPAKTQRRATGRPGGLPPSSTPTPGRPQPEDYHNAPWEAGVVPADEWPRGPVAPGAVFDDLSRDGQTVCRGFHTPEFGVRLPVPLPDFCPGRAPGASTHRTTQPRAQAATNGKEGS